MITLAIRGIVATLVFHFKTEIMHNVLNAAFLIPDIYFKRLRIRYVFIVQSGKESFQTVIISVYCMFVTIHGSNYRYDARYCDNSREY